MGPVAEQFHAGGDRLVLFYIFEEAVYRDVPTCGGRRGACIVRGVVCMVPPQTFQQGIGEDAMVMRFVSKRVEILFIGVGMGTGTQHIEVGFFILARRVIGLKELAD